MNRLAPLVAAGLLALIMAAPASAAKPLRPCSTTGMASYVDAIAKRGVSCADARIVIRSVEAHAAQCKPYAQSTIAPFRQCRVVPVLSTGERGFTCRSAYEVAGSNKRWWNTRCRSPLGDVVRYRRDGNAAT